jgi:circadian clock protein KaiB
MPPGNGRKAKVPKAKQPKATAPAKAAGRGRRSGAIVLRLYVAGTTPQSTRAILDARELCKEHLGGRYRLEVIDIYQRPTLARDEQIIAVPTLVRHLPRPLRKLVGDLSNSTRVLIGLDLLSKG